MSTHPFDAPGMTYELAGDIDDATMHPHHEDRVHFGLSLLDQAIFEIGTADSETLLTCATETVELEADDLFDIVSIVMDLDEPAARKIGLTGLVNALRAPDLEALQISCLAVQRFCSFAALASHARH